jgi:hypothetical protein
LAQRARGNRQNAPGQAKAVKDDANDKRVGGQIAVKPNAVSEAEEKYQHHERAE